MVCSDAKDRVEFRKATAPIHPCKTATLVPEFAEEDLPLDRTAALVPEFAVPWAEHSDDIYVCVCVELRVIGISGSLIWSKTLMELIFNPCSEFWRSPEGPFSQIHSPHLHVGAPGIFSDLLRFVLMLKREWGVESNGKLAHLFIPGKTAALVPEFVVEDLPSAELQPWFLRLQ